MGQPSSQVTSKYSGYFTCFDFFIISHTGLASNYASNRPYDYASSSHSNSATNKLESAALAWLTGTIPSNPGSATSGADKKLNQSGTYHTQPTYATSPSLEVYKTSQVFATCISKSIYFNPSYSSYIDKKPLTYTGQNDYQGYSSTQSHALPYSTNASEQYQSIPQGYLSTGSLPVPKPFVGSANYSTNRKIIVKQNVSSLPQFLQIQIFLKIILTSHLNQQVED